MGKDVFPGSAEAQAVDDAGVVELIGEDPVLGAQQRGQQTKVGLVAGWKDEGRLGALELG